MTSATTTSLDSTFDAFLAQRQANPRSGQNERKGSGLAWLPDFTKAQGLGSAAHVSAILGSKLGILAVAGFVAMGSVVAGLSDRRSHEAARKNLDERRFNASMLRDYVVRQNAEIAAAVPARRRNPSDSLHYVIGGSEAAQALPFDAAKALGATSGVSADAAAKAAADAAQAKSGKDGDAADAKSANDPKAIAEGLLAQAKAGAGAADGAAGQEGAAVRGAMGGGLRDALNGAFSHSGFGPALHSAAGMSSGIGRSFDSPHLKNSLLEKTGAPRDPGTASVVSNPVTKGSARNWAAARQISAVARNSADAQRLRQMSGLMANNWKGQVERPVAAQTAAWEATAAPSGVIQGAGASTGGTPIGSAATNPTTGESGPIDSGSETAAAPVTPAAVPTVPQDHSFCPYQWAIDLAKILLIVILVLSIIIQIFEGKAWFHAIAQALNAVVTICGVLLAMLGIYMMCMQQTMQGVIWTAIGAIVAALSWGGSSTVSIGSLAIATPIAIAIMALIGLGESK